MALAFVPFEERYLPAVRALNERLRAGNMPEGFLFAEDTMRHNEEYAGPPREQWLMVDDEMVRGGILLQEQPFRVRAEMAPVANVQTPVSEGYVDKRFAYVAAVMMKKLQAQQPRLFAVGMGNADLPFPRLAKAMGWEIRPVPFFFRVCRAGAFLRNIGPLRSRKLTRIAGELAARTGAGWLGLKAVQVARWKSIRPLKAEAIGRWDEWADPIWESAAPLCSFAAQRKGADLERFLPIGRNDLVAWRLEDGRTVGWAAALVHRIPHSTYFGSMVVGTLLDCLCEPGYEERVVATASDLMEQVGAELLISNQMHGRWQTAMRRAGYFSTSSNYLLGTSPALNKAVDFATAHITRADGDGRVNL